MLTDSEFSAGTGDDAGPSSEDILGGALSIMTTDLTASTAAGNTASLMDTCALAVMVLQVGDFKTPLDSLSIAVRWVRECWRVLSLLLAALTLPSFVLHHQVARTCHCVTGDCLL